MKPSAGYDTSAAGETSVKGRSPEKWIGWDAQLRAPHALPAQAQIVRIPGARVPVAKALVRLCPMSAVYRRTGLVEEGP